jgi:hypothetical protein
VNVGSFSSLPHPADLQSFHRLLISECEMFDEEIRKELRGLLFVSSLLKTWLIIWNKSCLST